MPPGRKESLVEARYGLIDAAVMLRELGEVLLGADEGQRALLDTAIRRGEAAMTPLAVLGAEGAGKSTFVDALVGEDIVPREELEPATVAPVLLRWGRSDSPAYVVVRNGGEEIQACENTDEFRELLLQRHNRHNRKQVQLGLVDLKHSLLAEGLLLLDMPGLAGVSDTVRQQAEAAVADLRRGVLIVRGRSYSVGARVVERWGENLDLEAVVSNWEWDFWESDGLEERVEEVRETVIDELDLELDPLRVFVVHLPSVADAAVRPDALVSHPVHHREVTNMATWARELAVGDVAYERLSEWAAALRAVHEPIDVLVKAHRKVTRALQQRQVTDVARARLAERAAACRAAVAGRWERERGSAVGAGEEAWRSLAPIVAAEREELLSAAAAAERKRNGMTWADGFDGETVETICGELESTVERALRRLDQGQEEAVLTVAKRYRELLNAAAALVPRYLPAVPWSRGVEISGPPLAELELRSEPTWGEVFDHRKEIDYRVRMCRDLAHAALLPEAAREIFDCNVERTAEVFQEEVDALTGHAVRRLLEEPEEREQLTEYLEQAADALTESSERIDAALAVARAATARTPEQGAASRRPIPTRRQAWSRRDTGLGRDVAEGGDRPAR